VSAERLEQHWTRCHQCIHWPVACVTKACVRLGGGHFEPMLYNNQEAAVRWNGQLTAWFPIEQGTRQGCNVSPTEFNLYAERIMRTVEENYEGVVNGDWWKTNNELEICRWHIITCQYTRIRKFFKDLVQESARYNMYINAQKSKMVSSFCRPYLLYATECLGLTATQMHSLHNTW